MLVDTLRRCMRLLVQFVRANKKNQHLVFKAALPQLTALMGPLLLPPFPYHDKEFTEEHYASMKPAAATATAADPMVGASSTTNEDLKGLNSEAVIIECLHSLREKLREKPRGSNLSLPGWLLA